MFGVQTLLSTLILAAVPSAEDATLLFVTTPGCAACQQVAPMIREIAEAGYSVQVLDSERDPDLVRQLQVREFPTFLMLSQDTIIDRCTVGGMERNAAKSRLFQMFEKSRQPKSPPDLSALQALTPPEPVFASPSPKTAAVPVSFTSPTINPPATSAFPTPALPPTAPPAQGERSLDPSPWVSSSVKLRVDAENAHSWGTGTIIDTRQGSALVLTCGHIFRDSKGRGKIEVQLFEGNSPMIVEGQCRYYDLEIDLALVVIEPPFPVRAIPLAPDHYPLAPGLEVLSVGCDSGADPTVRGHRILSTDRIGTPVGNAVPFHYVQVSGAPVGGRSGGGLFAREGYLIGVCNTADPVQDDGHFVPPSMIRRVLKQLDLAVVADNPSLIDSVGVPTAVVAPAAAPVAAFPLVGHEELQPLRVPVSLDVPHAPASDPVRQATLEQLRNRSLDGDEIIVIVRSKKNPEKPIDFIVLNASSDEVLDALALPSTPPAAAPAF